MLALILVPFWGVAQETIPSPEPEVMRDSPISFDIVSPLEGEVVSGQTLFMIHPSVRTTGRGELTIGEFSFSFSADTSWSVPFDSFLLENSEHTYSITLCEAESCTSRASILTVQNVREVIGLPDSRPPLNESRLRRIRDVEILPDVPLVPNTLTFSINPSNVPSFLRVLDSSGTQPIARSTGDPITLPANTYDFSFTFPSELVSSLLLDNVAVANDGRAVSVRRGPFISPILHRGTYYEIVSSSFFSFGFPSVENQVTIPLVDTLTLFFCSRFDFTSGNCGVSWTPIPRSGDHYMHSWSGREGLFARARPSNEAVPSLPLFSISLANVPGEYYVSSPRVESGPFDSNAYLFEEGEYSLRLVPFVGPLSLIRSSEVYFNHDGTFLSILEKDSVPTTGGVWEVWSYTVDYSIASFSATLVPSYFPELVFSCKEWNDSLGDCATDWISLPNPTLSPGLTYLKVFRPLLEDGAFDDSIPNDPELLWAIEKLKQLHTNKRFFNGVLAQDTFPVLQNLFSNVEVDLECDPSSASLSSRDFVDSQPLLSSIPAPYLDQNNPLYYTNLWEPFVQPAREHRQTENTLECDGVLLSNEWISQTPPSYFNELFLRDYSSRVKQSISLRNTTSQAQTRSVNIRLESPFRVKTDSQEWGPNSSYRRIPSSFSNGVFSENRLAFLDGGQFEKGYYDVSDFLANDFDPRIVIHRKGALFVIETLLSVTIPPNGEVILDPVYSLSASPNYSIRFSGGTASDFLGRINTDGGTDTPLPRTLGSGVKLVNIDNGSYANDILFGSSGVDYGARVNNGAVFLFRNIDLNTGSFDLNQQSSPSVVWYGSVTNDAITISSYSGDSFQVVNTDGNSYANDLIIMAPNTSFGASAGGSVYIIRDIDKKSGLQDLNNTDNFTTRWDGSTGTAALGYTNNSGQGVRLINIDNNAAANDLLISSPTSGTIFSGAVYLIKDVNAFTGILHMSSTSSYSAAWVGGSALDAVGSISDSGEAVQVVNLDGNAYANDLIIGGSTVDAGAADNGAVYIIKDADKKVGSLTLSSSTNYDVRFAGATASDKIGESLTSGQGLQLIDSDGNGVSNDLLIIATNADINSISNNGAIYLIKDINTLSGNLALSSGASYSTRWHGHAANDALGGTEGSGLGVQVVNLDGNVVANDLIVGAFAFNTAALANTGVVFVIRDINRLSGNIAMNDSNAYNVRITGGQADDSIPSTEFGGQGMQLVNVDNNLYANDLIISGSAVDAAASDTGAVYLIRDLNAYTTTGNTLDLNSTANFSLRFSPSTTLDQLGDTNNSGTGALLVNADNNAYANDLILWSPAIDVNSKVNAGAIYLIKDIDKKSGIKDLSAATDYDVAWLGARAQDFMGLDRGSGQGVSLVNLDKNSYANDLIILSSLADTGDVNSGSVTLLLDIDNVPAGSYDLNNLNHFYRRYNGGALNDYLGATDNSPPGFFLKDIDNDGYRNDLILTAVNADVNSKLDVGAVYIITNTAFGKRDDFSFTLLLPSSSCTNGKGNITGGTACQKGYIEAFSDTTATQNKVDPDGQTASIPFFIYDNQSTSSSDFNVVIDLNVALPSTLKLKASQQYLFWSATCSGNPETGCIQLSDSNASAGKMRYSIGTQDLNLWLWGDFIVASGQVDRNVVSGGVLWDGE